MNEQERIDALIEAVERELAAEERTESVRLTRNMTDPVFARRSRRRSGRVALRRLPAGSPGATLAEFDGEAA
ncbi:hypothetical protein [Amycolatopsis nigrescens]|uniref:hypothetical protein n=1 Tax=Amycolatopsis nigrescens TaxID=381445 RepID=UPI0003A9410D|nr:hypothetical protein [Amycolatopsis nigrescens]